MAADPEIQIKRCICIHFPVETAPWIIVDTEMIDGHTFIELKRRDSGFCRFIAGKAWRKVPTMSFLNDLQRRRTSETILSCLEASLFDDALPTKAAKKRARYDASRKADNGELKPWIALSLPELVGSDGTVVQPCVIKVKPSLKTGEALVVDLSIDTLTYIRKAMLLSQKPDADIYAKKDGARWRTDRNYWAVSREENGTVVPKTFKPKSNAEEDVLEARDEAIAWSQGFLQPLADGADSGEGEGVSDGDLPAPPEAVTDA